MSVIKLKNNQTATDPRLGRIPQFDERSKAFPIRALVAGKPRRSYSWRTTVQLDQGNTPACTGFSLCMEAAARPVVVTGITDSDGMKIYHRAQELDEWPGSDYEGSSVLAAMKAGVERGWYKEYRWALGPGAEAAENDLALAVGYKGPAILGTNWYDGMFDADEDGYLNVSGSLAGGHAYVITKYSVKRDAYWTPNSWGGAGQGWIRRADIIRLLSEDGEAVVPTIRSKG